MLDDSSAVPSAQASCSASRARRTCAQMDYTAPGLGRASDDRPVAPATASTVGRRSPKGSGSAGPPATDQDRLARVFSGRAAQDAAYLHDTQSVHVPLGIPTRVAGSRTARGSTTGTWPSRRTRGVRSCSIAGSSVAGIAGPPGPRTRTLCRRSARSRLECSIATRTQFLTSKAVAPHMITKGSGVIMMITATPARVAFPLVGVRTVLCPAPLRVLTESTPLATRRLFFSWNVSILG